MDIRVGELFTMKMADDLRDGSPLGTNYLVAVKWFFDILQTQGAPRRFYDRFL